MPATPGTTQIGFVGLGIMGAPMALNLIEAGFSLKVYNRTDRPRVQEVIDAGGVRAATPAEAASGSDVIITNVTDTPDVVDVILGEDGVLQTAREGTTVIDMSTISPRVTRDIAAALNEKGVHMLDAPVSGGDVGAQQGTLSIMVGGEQSVFDDCLPVFEAMGKNINRIGGNGAGQTTKACNQIAVSVANLAMAEALMLAAASDLDVGKVVDAISGGAAASWNLTNLGPRILKATSPRDSWCACSRRTSNWFWRPRTTSSSHYPVSAWPTSSSTSSNDSVVPTKGRKPSSKRTRCRLAKRRARKTGGVGPRSNVDPPGASLRFGFS